MLTLYKYLLIDLLKNKALILYTLLLGFSTFGMFYIESDVDKVLLSIMQISVLGIPLFCMLFSAIYFYHSSDFIELILAQPIKRSAPIMALFLALFSWFTLSLMLAVGLPIIFYGAESHSILLVLGSLLLQFVSITIALLIGVLITDKAKGIGIILIIWAFIVFIFDGLLLLIMYQFSAYPIEKVILALTFLNPITITRTLVVLGTEASATLGLSAAVFTKFFGSIYGLAISLASLVAWGLIPLFGTIRFFKNKDF